MEYPRLLFVTPHAFNHLMGGGITFSNLFSGWPKDRLACVHSDTVPTTDDVCHHYYKLGPAELDIAAPLQMLRSVLRSRRSDNPGNLNAADGMAVEGSRAGGGFLSRAQRFILGGTPPEAARLTPELESWIADFRPDLLFTLLGSNGIMSLVEAIRRRFQLPLIPHIMDDWPSAAYRDGLLGPWQRWAMERWLKHFFSVADTRLGIGTAMCKAFEARYRQAFLPFQNTLDVARWSVKAKSDLTAGRPAHLLYVGSVFANAQLQSLIDCAVAVRELNRAGMTIRLSVASPGFLVEPHREKIAIDSSISIVPPITDDEEFFSQLASADALLLPANFDAESIRMIRYSMPTKVPAYLVSGTPILVYGPAEVAQVSYAQSRGWGHVIHRREPALLQKGLREIMGDVELRVALSRAARTVAAVEHDAARVRRRFQDVLCGAARVSRVAGERRVT